jgi:hypothetical protein
MRKHYYIILPLIVTAVSLFDLMATIHFSETNSGFEELNPIVKFVWEKYDNLGLVLLKTFSIVPWCLCMAWVLKNGNRSQKAFVTVLGLSVSCLLMGWWTFWIFL